MSGERRLRKRRFGVVPAIVLAALLLAAVDFVLFANRAAGADHSPDVNVDIGYVAETTRGNADETAAWAYEQGYKSLIIVTSDYHMPRSLIVLETAMPDIELIAWPVRTVNDPASIWTDPDSFRGVVLEWAKWRVTTFE